MTIINSVPTSDVQSAATPDSVLAWLKESNARFVDGNRVGRDWEGDVAITADGQFPLAAFVSCIDSRVPPEIVFDLGLGDVFAARTAGNVIDTDVIGSLEFASAVAGVKVIVVLGHTACGAVKGACDGVELGHLTSLLAKITPAVEAVTGETAPGSGDADVVNSVVKTHVDNTVVSLAETSDVLRGLVDEGRLLIVGATYDLATGRVDWH